MNLFTGLHNYLRDRYADRIVLTFAQIEDLTGAALPAVAIAQEAWWANPDAGTSPSAQADAWRLAGRTATVNLAARIVVFEREVPAAPNR